MVQIRRAENHADFDTVAEMLRRFGAWDASVARHHGVPAELVVELFHGTDSRQLSEKYGGDDGAMLLAIDDGEIAGCIAFGPFDEDATEIKSFYVEPSFRGRRIGTTLLGATLDTIASRPRRHILLQTTEYMSDALRLYHVFGFRRCEAFRPIPDVVRHTEVFMSRPARISAGD